MDERGESVSPSEEAKPEDRFSGSQSPIAAQVPPAPSQTNQPNRSEDNTPHWKKTAEIIAIGIAGGLLFVNILALCAAKKAAEASANSVKIAEKTMVLDERARGDCPVYK